MNNIFSYIWRKGEAHVFNGRLFLTKEVNEELQTQFTQFALDQNTAAKKYELPLPLRILSYIFLLAGAIIVGSIISTLPDISIAQAYANAPVLFYVGPCCLVIWLVLFLINIRLHKKGRESDEYKMLEANAETLLQKSNAELGIPADASKIDVVMNIYKEKKGFVKTKANVNMLDERSVFIQNDNICFADIATVVTVPLASVRNVRFVKKRTLCSGGWNKEEKINSPRYKKYVYMNNGNIVLKSHYVIELADVRGEFEILIPSYDFDTLAEVTGYRVAYSGELK